MKFLLLSDIHGNLSALEAVLRHARMHGKITWVLNMGDSFGYGPQPDEVVRRLQDPSFINILGNYDKKVLNKKNRKTGWAKVKTAEKRAMFSWTYEALSKQTRKYLQNLPEQRVIETDNIRILMTHGSPVSPAAHLHPDTLDKGLVEQAEAVKAGVVLSGHSHQSFHREVNHIHFINPGSVGRPDDGDPRASYALLEVKGSKLTVDFFRVSYNITAAVHALQNTGLPVIFAEILLQGRNYDETMSLSGGAPGEDRLEPNGVVTLLTDFGLQDHFVGVMKGVIASIAPHAQLVDISHQIQPQNVVDASRMLMEAIPFFPAGTVHIAVVDPGVGTHRRAIAARIGQHFYVAPDNGLLSKLIQTAGEMNQPVEIVRLCKPHYWLPDPSQTFHGRDIFAPVGAHLVNGLLLETLGAPIDDPVVFEWTVPQKTSTGWQAEVVGVDVFGNLSTNLRCGELPGDATDVVIHVLGEAITGLYRTFGEAKPGTLIGLCDSTDHLAVVVVNGNAAEMLGAKVGTPVDIIIRP